MNTEKLGNFIRDIRIEKGLTQQNIADALHISNKTVSKWERAQGCPDISVLSRLSEILGVDIQKMLEGDLEPNKPDIGNMRNIKFYVCPVCGNILTSLGNSTISCCGRILKALEPQKEIEGHNTKVEKMDLDYYISLEHEMTKEHYINFVAFVSQDKVLINRLYPEQMCETRIPATMRRGMIYVNCTNHGLVKILHRG